MKLQPSLICAIVVGISAGITLSSCHRDDVKDGTSTIKADHKQKKKPSSSSVDPCPVCGMG